MSADKIDHKAAAEYLQDRGSNSPLDGSYSFQNDTETLLSALTSATLYAAEQTAALVEQQRIANLIALESAEFVMADEWIPASEGRTRVVDAEKTMKRYENACRIIVDGLGLA